MPEKNYAYKKSQIFSINSNTKNDKKKNNTISISYLRTISECCKTNPYITFPHSILFQIKK